MHNRQLHILHRKFTETDKIYTRDHKTLHKTIYAVSQKKACDAIYLSIIQILIARI